MCLFSFVIIILKGLYQYTDSQSSRHQYQRGSIEYDAGGGGGLGTGHSQGIQLSDSVVVQDFFVMRQASQSLNSNQNNGQHHDW